MQFGLSLPNNYGVEDVQAIVRLATTAEQLGFHSVWVSEHLFKSSMSFNGWETGRTTNRSPSSPQWRR